ncbi:hypothetical protein [Bradyrhizobium cosmicum]|uniref:Uncharacterized protein n=1 Tax=Bradyrhizobium cosmicum TaxID=1404864 RepID=A0AAI8MCU7_9BRAD|nr:hypothetical protein [Bradyrhizobium cosmicum]BAL76026.1 hypothetical protein S23_28140 [Bradyrhizobium cosmicum]
MPALTRRRSDNSHQETWHIYFEDVRIGHIGMHSGVPLHQDQWGWGLGFYPGMEKGPRGGFGGTAATFEDARAAFEARWKLVEPTITEADYEAWRRDRDLTAWKYRMWDEHCMMPTQTQSGRSRCFCGTEIGLGSSLEEHVITAHRGIGA